MLSSGAAPRQSGAACYFSRFSSRGWRYGDYRWRRRMLNTLVGVLFITSQQRGLLLGINPSSNWQSRARSSSSRDAHTGPVQDSSYE